MIYFIPVLTAVIGFVGNIILIGKLNLSFLYGFIAGAGLFFIIGWVIASKYINTEKAKAKKEKQRVKQFERFLRKNKNNIEYRMDKGVYISKTDDSIFYCRNCLQLHKLTPLIKTKNRNIVCPVCQDNIHNPFSSISPVSGGKRDLMDMSGY